MAELARQLLRYARLPARAARLTFDEPGSALLALRMAYWVAALSLLVKLMPLPRALKLVAPRARGARPRDPAEVQEGLARLDRKSTRLNSSHTVISYAVFCLKKKKQKE